MKFFILLFTVCILANCSKKKDIIKGLYVIDIDAMDKEFENSNKDLN